MKSEDLEKLLGEAEQKLDEIKAALETTPSEHLVAGAKLLASRCEERREALQQNRENLYTALVMLAYAAGIRALLIPHSREWIQLFSGTWVRKRNSFRGDLDDFMVGTVLAYSREEFSRFSQVTLEAIQAKLPKLLSSEVEEGKSAKEIAAKIMELVEPILARQ